MEANPKKDASSLALLEIWWEEPAADMPTIKINPEMIAIMKVKSIFKNCIMFNVCLIK